jgi:hypothetical protein
MGNAGRLIDNDAKQLLPPGALEFNLDDLNALGISNTPRDLFDFGYRFLTVHSSSISLKTAARVAACSLRPLNRAAANKKVGLRPLFGSDLQIAV